MLLTHWLLGILAGALILFLLEIWLLRRRLRKWHLRHPIRSGASRPAALTAVDVCSAGGKKQRAVFAFDERSFENVRLTGMPVCSKCGNGCVAYYPTKFSVSDCCGAEVRL